MRLSITLSIKVRFNNRCSSCNVIFVKRVYPYYYIIRLVAGIIYIPAGKMNERDRYEMLWKV